MKRALKLALITGILFALSACSDDDLLNTNFDFDTAEEAILALIAGTDSLEQYDGLNDGEAVNISSSTNGSLNKTAGDTIQPVRIGRRIDSKSFERSVEIIGDTIAIVTSVGTISGDFIIVYTLTDSSSLDTIAKPFEMEMTRKIKLRRIGDGEVRRLNWRIIGITPVVGGTVNTTFEFQSFMMISLSGDSLVITDPFNTFYSWTDLPDFEPGDTVNVFLSLSNSSAYEDELVLLHHGARSRLDKGRRQLLDDGTGIDAVPDDNTYSNSFRSRETRGRMRHGFVDAIDWGTVFDIDGPVNMKVWGIPYQIRHRR